MTRIFKTLSLLGLFSGTLTSVEAQNLRLYNDIARLSQYDYKTEQRSSSQGAGNAFYGWEANAESGSFRYRDAYGMSGGSYVGHSISAGIHPGLVGGFGGIGGGFAPRGPTPSPYGNRATLRGMGGGVYGSSVYEHGYVAATGGSVPRPDPQAAAQVGAGPTARMDCRLQKSAAGYQQKACTGPNDGSYVVPEFDTVCWRQNVAALTQNEDQQAYLAALGPKKLVYLCRDYPAGSVDVEPVEGGTYLKIVFTSPKLVPVPAEKPGRKLARTLIAKD